MKRKITFLVCLLLLLALTAAPILAAETVSVSAKADKTSVGGGDTITVTVSAEVDTCQQGGIQITFDSAIFELTGGKCTLDNADIDYFDPATKDGAFAFGNGSALSGSVFEFTLKVKDTAAAGSYTVSVDFTADDVTKTATATVTIACAHTYDSGKVTKAATCTEDGVKTYTCSKCGGTKTETIAKTGHSYDGGKVTKAATCTEDGVKTYTCSKCGATKTETIAKTGHSYDGGKVTKEATCAEDGVKTYTCACGATKTEAIAKTGHKFVGEVTKEATCSETGTETYTCEKCGVYYYEDIAKKAHDYKSEVTTEATCQAEGVKTVTCANCGASYTDSLDKLDHTYDDDCDEDCNVCGETRVVEHIYSQYLSADESGHWYECNICGDVLAVHPHTPGPEATEEEDQICLDCGFVLQKAGAHVHAESGDWLSDENEHWRLCGCGEIMAKAEHTWILNQLDEEAGMEIYLCMECGLTKEEPMPTQPSLPETQPTETQPTENQPSETQPSETQPQDQPTVPGGENSGEKNESFPWWIVWVVVGVLLAGGAIFVAVGILMSRKQVGKYSK